MSGFRNGEGSGLIHLPGTPIEVSKEKCKCGKTKFEYQEVCGECALKKMSEEKKKEE